MEIEFILPDIGEGIVECELLEWLVSEGEMIEEDQPVAEVMTDKATVQIPAMHAGIVKSLHYKEVDIAKVHSPLFTLEPKDTVNQDNIDADEATKNVETSTNMAQTSHAVPNHIEDFILPDIGEGIVECEIVKWNVKEGDTIAEDQSVVEVMTDKAVVEIPAKSAGTVHKLYYNQGDIAKVHTPLFALSTEGKGDTQLAATNSVSNTDVVRKSASSANAHALAAENKWQDGSVEPPCEIPGRILASPAVRRIARENNINLSDVTPTGKKGRILKQDITQFLSQQRNNATVQSSPEAKTAALQSSSYNTQSDSIQGDELALNKRTVKVRGVQAAMAKQMVASVSTIPHFMVSDEVRMDNLIALREKLKPEFEAQGVKLSFMPFFIKAMSLALSKYPIVNSQLNDDGSELTYFDDHNIGFAVDTKVGLMVPNIKRVQSLSLFEIAQKMQEIISQAREGKVVADALKGGTISISNIGAIGGITATPVINKPEAAIVAIGKTQKLPRFDQDGNVEVQHIMTVNWSGDHRIIDGATMVRFNNLWSSYLMSPENMLMHLK